MNGEQEALITGQEAAKLLGVSYSTLYRRAKEGAIPHHWEWRGPLDKRPRLMFKVSEIAAAITRIKAERKAPGAAPPREP